MGVLRDFVFILICLCPIYSAVYLDVPRGGIWFNGSIAIKNPGGNVLPRYAAIFQISACSTGYQGVCGAFGLTLTTTPSASVPNTDVTCFGDLGYQGVSYINGQYRSKFSWTVTQPLPNYAGRQCLDLYITLYCDASSRRLQHNFYQDSNYVTPVLESIEFYPGCNCTDTTTTCLPADLNKCIQRDVYESYIAAGFCGAVWTTQENCCGADNSICCAASDACPTGSSCTGRSPVPNPVPIDNPNTPTDDSSNYNSDAGFAASSAVTKLPPVVGVVSALVFVGVVVACYIRRRNMARTALYGMPTQQIIITPSHSPEEHGEEEVMVYTPPIVPLEHIHHLPEMQPQFIYTTEEVTPQHVPDPFA